MSCLDVAELRKCDLCTWQLRVQDDSSPTKAKEQADRLVTEHMALHAAEGKPPQRTSDVEDLKALAGVLVRMSNRSGDALFKEVTHEWANFLYDLADRRFNMLDMSALCVTCTSQINSIAVRCKVEGSMD